MTVTKIPDLSVAVAVVLGIITILAIVAFIDHGAHSMDISNILHDVEREAVLQIRREWEPFESRLQWPGLNAAADSPPVQHPFRPQRLDPAAGRRGIGRLSA